ncbi:MAG: ATP-binding protein [Phycisphaerales bacterium]|nr:MAG: ATP-binding protein [Phycisphaerales bacterium]
MTDEQYPIQEQASRGALPAELSENIRGMNPWWRGEPAPRLPEFHRWPYARLRHLLDKGIAPATVLRGPRQVGKTVLVRQLINALLEEEIAADRILFVSFDELPTHEEVREPALTIARWFEAHVLKETFNAADWAFRPAYVFFDEVQNLDAWAPQVKSLVDNHRVRVLLTGSSSLRIEAGRDSLAGRVTTLDLGPLLLREIAGIRFGVEGAPYWVHNALDSLIQMEFWQEAIEQARRERPVRDQAFVAFAERGAYPVAHQRGDVPWPQMADQLNETVIKRAIEHDLRMGERGRKRDQALLEEVFRLCCRYAGQTPGSAVFVPEIRQSLAADIGWNRILTYLRFLDGTLLMRLIQPMELRLKRRKSPAKICLCDHGLRASWLEEVVPLDPDRLAASPHLSDLAGQLAESVLGYFLASVPNLDVPHFPTRATEPEVDFVLTVGVKRIPIEVKYRRRIDCHEDTRGLRAFLEKTVYNAPFGILVTLDDDVVVKDPRIVSMSLSSLLWLR